MTPVGNKYVIIIGTLDTKGPEVSYLSAQVEQSGFNARIIDVGFSADPSCEADIRREEVAIRANSDIASMLTQDDGKIKAMEAMARGALSLVEEKIDRGEAIGVMALGGGVGTWIGMKVMRSLIFGFPKIMVSTLPFDIRNYLGSKDIVLFPSVTDILGLNPILRKILQNAAGAMMGMIGTGVLPQSSKKVIGITALGVTTPLVTACKEILEKNGFEVAAFHGVGIGGRTYEEWVDTGMFAGVLDVTPHDINNFLFNGISTPYPDRLETAARKKIPQVVAPGGLDFISRGPVDALSDEDREKPHYRHSPMFTHVRVNALEMKQVAQTVADKLNKGQGCTAVAIPLQGFSFQGHATGHLADHQSDMMFVKTLKEKLKDGIIVTEVDAHLNDKLFAQAVCSLLFQLLRVRC